MLESSIVFTEGLGSRREVRRSSEPGLAQERTGGGELQLSALQDFPQSLDGDLRCERHAVTCPNGCSRPRTFAC